MTDTPTTVQIRDILLLGAIASHASDEDQDELLEMFDRWLETHDSDTSRAAAASSDDRFQELNTRTLRGIAQDRVFLQRVADSYGIRTDEVTESFLAQRAADRPTTKLHALTHDFGIPDNSSTLCEFCSHEWDRHDGGSSCIECRCVNFRAANRNQS
jgi:hypothetical protein